MHIVITSYVVRTVSRRISSVYCSSVPHNVSMSKVDGSSKKAPYKRTDFRYEIWLKDRRALKAKAKRDSFKVEAQLNANLPKRAVNAVCVDTTKARSTLDVIRICLRELGWREVSTLQ